MELSALTSVLVPAVVTLLVFALSNRFAKKSRQEQWQQNRDEWMLEKEARDIEEIIATLSKFLKDFSDVTNDMNTEQETLAWLLRDLREDKTIVAANPSYVTFLETRWLKNAREFTTTCSENRERLNKLMAEVSLWFSFDSTRLSVWFDSEGNDRAELVSIGKRFQDHYGQIDNFFFLFSIYIDRLIRENQDADAFEIKPNDIQEINECEAGTKAAFSRWSSLTDEIVDFQRALVDRFRPSKAEVEVIHVSKKDGLLVKLARWTERNLRLLLKLG